MNINVKEARGRFSALLNKVEDGEEVVILRRGKAVARLIPCDAKKREKLPSLKEFRASIAIGGESLGKAVITNRAEERS